MNRNIIISFGLHTFLVIITAMSLPFLSKKPIDLPPIVSIELIQITDKTNIPFAPKAKKIIEKIKKKEKEKHVSEQKQHKITKIKRYHLIHHHAPWSLNAGESDDWKKIEKSSSSDVWSVSQPFKRVRKCMEYDNVRSNVWMHKASYSQTF